MYCVVPFLNKILYHNVYKHITTSYYTAEEQAMTNIVILGGNGYIGRTIIQEWLKIDDDTLFFVYSRSGENKLQHPNIKNQAVDLQNYEQLKSYLPGRIDYVVDLVGRPDKNIKALTDINEIPAKIMLKIAGDYNVKGMGFIQGSLGPKSFVNIKKDIAKMLTESGVHTAIVNPTIVYGNDRSDSLAKLVPIFKFLGMFSDKFRPTHVNSVAKELINKLTHSTK